MTANNDGSIISNSVTTVRDDLIGDLEENKEHQPLLGFHGHKKMLVATY